MLRFFDKDEYYPQRVTLMNVGEMNTYLKQEEMDSINGHFKSRLNKEINLEYYDSTIEINGLAKIPKDALKFRLSMSDYAYSSNSYLFGLLYMMAATLYIYNGVVYWKRKETLDVQRWGSRANVIIGIFLIGVVINPQSTNAFLHNAFSISFFLGNIAVMLFLPKQDEKPAFKWARISMGSLCLLILLGAFMKFYSLLWAEWMSLTIIAIYLIAMSQVVHRKPDRNTTNKFANG
ncbi:MAG: DUF998 domain-containing protein [Flavitalea sp.]